MFWSGSRGTSGWGRVAGVYLVLENWANSELSSEMVRRRGAEVGSEIASWQVRTSARLRWVIYSFLAWRGERAAEPGRCQRGGSNDDLYPLLPVLLPTRDNTNHYHRLITGITANIEIMRACVCARAHAGECVRVLASTQRLTRSYRPAEGVAPLSLVFLLRHPLSLSRSLLLLSWRIRRCAVFNDVAGIIHGMRAVAASEW